MRKIDVLRRENLHMLKFPLFLITILFLTQCSNDDPAPAMGKITGSVTDVNTGSGLEGTNVIVFDATFNSPQATTVTDASGNYTIEMDNGTYFLKFYKQGYLSLPPSGIDAVAFDILQGTTVNQPAEMTPSDLSDAGFITGKIANSSGITGGILVIAAGSGSAHSGVTDNDGNYTIFNVPAGAYEVKAYLAEYSSDMANTSVTTNTETNDVNLTLTKNASGHVAGTFKVISQTTIATPPVTMKISLVHALTGETVPGLTQSLPYSSSISFSFSNVPDGDYIVRATYENDYIVIDPDYITKFGDYKVSLSSGVADLVSVDIVATSAVIPNSPTNEMSTTAPIAASVTPTFSWSAYPSTSDYVIEVTDATTGQVVWGGFTKTDGVITKNIVIESNVTSVEFNYDGTASVAALTAGKIYRWRVYASKDNVQTGWNLIAASENQMGLIKVE
jgi:hypothetical protein